MADKPRYLDTQNVADELGMEKRTVENWRYLSPPFGPPFTHIRGLVRYPSKAFEEWCAEQDSRTAS